MAPTTRMVGISIVKRAECMGNSRYGERSVVVDLQKHDDVASVFACLYIQIAQ